MSRLYYFVVSFIPCGRTAYKSPSEWGGIHRHDGSYGGKLMTQPEKYHGKRRAEDAHTPVDHTYGHVCIGIAVCRCSVVVVPMPTVEPSTRRADRFVFPTREEIYAHIMRGHHTTPVENARRILRIPDWSIAVRIA